MKTKRTQSTAPPSPASEKAPAISSVEVAGYKSIRSTQSIALRPLTVLAGVNSSGKSSMIQPLLLLKQTLEAPYDPGPLLLDGPNVKFTMVDQTLFRGGEGDASTGIVVKIGKNDQASIAIHLSKKTNGGRSTFELASQRTVDSNEGVIEISPESKDDEIIEQLSKNPSFGLYVDPRLLNNERWLASVQRNRCFLDVLLLSGNASVRIPRSLLSPARVHAPLVMGMIHLPGLRGNPQRSYRVTAVGETFPGTFPDYAASVISSWSDQSSEKLKQLGEDLRHLGLTWKVEARSVGDTLVELRVGRLPRRKRGGSRDLVNIADVGVGVSQTLPVLVALLTAKPGQLVYIEQPEIHLHPRAQVAMAELLANAARRGVRVVIETHGALLLLGIQALVAEGRLECDKVALHWFNRDQHTGETTVQSADLDEAGRFGDWPVDFSDVSLETQHRYLSAAEPRLWNGAASK